MSPIFFFFSFFSWVRGSRRTFGIPAEEVGEQASSEDTLATGRCLADDWQF